MLNIYLGVLCSDDNELCGTTGTQDVCASGVSVGATGRRDENYVCIIFNFVSAPRRNGADNGAPYEDSRLQKTNDHRLCFVRPTRRATSENQRGWQRGTWLTSVLSLLVHVCRAHATHFRSRDKRSRYINFFEHSIVQNPSTVFVLEFLKIESKIFISLVLCYSWFKGEMHRMD